MRINVDGRAARVFSAVDVAPAVAHEEAGGRVQVQSLGGGEYHARSRFVVDGVVFVVADLNGIQRKVLEKPSVHGLDRLLILSATTDIGLVSDDD